VDFGELDNAVLNREKDAGNGFKHSGWTNPLGWTDSGSDDDTVLTLLNGAGNVSERKFKDVELLQYAESEGPTKVDFGELDNVIINREKDAGNGFKHSGWTNPIGWTDNGEDDESVLTQLNSIDEEEDTTAAQISAEEVMS